MMDEDEKILCATRSFHLTGRTFLIRPLLGSGTLGGRANDSRSRAFSSSLLSGALDSIRFEARAVQKVLLSPAQ